jgi:hypothetical protein
MTKLHDDRIRAARRRPWKMPLRALIQKPYASKEHSMTNGRIPGIPSAGFISGPE